MYVYLNNQFIEEERATLHISDLAIQRGYGIFDFFRLANNRLLFVDDHLDRFARSAGIMHLASPYPRKKLNDILQELVKTNRITNAGIRMILTGGYSPDAYNPVEPNFIIMQNALELPELRTPKAVSIITHEFVRDIPDAKTINYSMGIWLQVKLKEKQADDVLYHIDGVVTEFPRCNFFIITRDNVMVTPEKNTLKGVTRKRILKGASGRYTVKEAPVTLQDVRSAKEAFLTSTTKRIQSVVKMDGIPVGDGKPGPVATEMLKMLVDEEKSL